MVLSKAAISAQTMELYEKLSDLIRQRFGWRWSWEAQGRRLPEGGAQTNATGCGAVQTGLRRHHLGSCRRGAGATPGVPQQDGDDDAGTEFTELTMLKE